MRSKTFSVTQVITIRYQILKQNLKIQGYVVVDWNHTAEDRTNSRLWWTW